LSDCLCVVLSLDDDIIQLDVANDGSVLAVSDSGDVAIWYGTTILASTDGKSMAYQPASIVRFTDSIHNEPIRVLSAHFVRGHTDRVMVARGSSAKPTFEQLVSGNRC
jgi:hypothetical protein